MASTIRVQIENFAFSWGFKWLGYGSIYGADGGFAFVQPGAKAAGAVQFTGESGLYDIKLHYMAESISGASAYLVDVNNTGDDSDIFYSQSSSAGSPYAPASYMTHDDVALKAGDVITVYAAAFGQQHAAVDYIEFIPVEEQQPTPVPVPVPTPTPTPTPTPVPAPAPSTGDTPSTLDAFEQRVLDLTNAERAKVGLGPLRYDPQLSAAADKHSKDMAVKNYFSHVEPDGDTLGDRIRDEGYAYRRAGENIAAGYDTPEEVVDAWMNSSGHRANILNPNFAEIGVGYYEDTPDDRYDHYWTQVFATELDVA